MFDEKTHFILQDSGLDNRTAVSPVLGSSVANLSISNLTENITFTITHSNLTQVSINAKNTQIKPSKQNLQVTST